MGLTDFPITSYDERFWQTPRRIESARSFDVVTSFADKQRIVDFVLLGKRLELRRRIVNRHTNDDKTFGSVLLLKLHEPGDFDLTWRAPGGPEIEQDDFPFLRRQIEIFAVRIFQYEVQVRRFGIRVTCGRRCSAGT